MPLSKPIQQYRLYCTTPDEHAKVLATISYWIYSALNQNMVKIIAHRGFHTTAQENSLDAIKQAIAQKVDGIEFDLRVTKDGVVVLHHDPFVLDINGQKIQIATHTYGELHAHQPALTTFAGAVKAVHRRVPLLVEIKPRVPLAPIVAEFRTFLREGWKPSDFAVCSFSQRALQGIHKTLPEIQLVVNARYLSTLARIRARLVHTKRISMNQRYLWYGAVATLRRGGYEIYTYTLNDTAKASRWEKHGLLGIITDAPHTYRKR